MDPNPTTSDRPVAVVTGGTKGIGLATARALLAEGYRVAASARTAADVSRIESELEGEFGGRVLGVVCDVRASAQCDALIDATVERFGRLDVLVNNAGLGIFRPTDELTDEDWSRQIDTNLSGAFYCSRAAVPHLKRSDGAWIIHIGSLAGRNPFAGGVAYNATKFGLLGMAEAMMLDLRYDGIRVTTIMPGSVNTHFFGRVPEPDSWRLDAEDVARAIVDLLRYPSRAHPSRVELRPSMPPRK